MDQQPSSWLLQPPDSTLCWGQTPEAVGKHRLFLSKGVKVLGSCSGSHACLGVEDGLEPREARGRGTGSEAVWLQ